MNVRCPSCETVYRVDPAKVPDEGVRASCASCGSVFPVTHQREDRSSTETEQPVIEQQTEPVDVVEPSVPDISPSPATQPPAFELEVAGDSSEEQESPPAQPMSLVEAAEEPPPPNLDFDPLPIEVPEIDEPVVPQTAPPVQQEAPAPTPSPPAAPKTPVTPLPTKPRVSKPFIQPGGGSPAGAPPRAPARPTAPVFKPTPGMPIQRPPVPAPPAPEVTAPVPAIETPEPPRAEPGVSEPPPAPAPPPAGDKKPVNPFLSKDPAQKARRLARALVSDMIVYQPKKRQDAIAAGNLKDAFDEEIKKSWEEYVQQVGEELADSTDYFKEALNEILAGGRSIF